MTGEALKAKLADVYRQRQQAWDQYQRLDGAAQMLEHLLAEEAPKPDVPADGPGMAGV